MNARCQVCQQTLPVGPTLELPLHMWLSTTYCQGSGQIGVIV